MHPEIEIMTCLTQPFLGMFTESFGGCLLKSRENLRKCISKMPTVRNDTVVVYSVIRLPSSHSLYVSTKNSELGILGIFGWPVCIL